MSYELDLSDEDADPRPPRRAPRSPAKPWLVAVAAAALLGAIFSAVSTADFISHLDRQVHSIHCSFIPGAGPEIGDSGCRTVMMSPYSSLFRGLMWGGLPISLLALAVFAYLAYRATDLAFGDSTRERTKFLVLATALPLLMTVVYGTISAVLIGALCKLCAGVYAVSIAGFVFALVAHSKAAPPEYLRPSTSLYVRWFLEGLAYVAALVILYTAFAPKSDQGLEGCGSLVRAEDPHGIIVPFQSAPSGEKSIVVLDPLCPACRAFDQRLAASGLGKRLDLSAVMFPLDSECNWMVQGSLHPGACAVSEAILCDKERAKEIVDWAFMNQENLTTVAKQDPGALREQITRRFPSTAQCLGSANVKNKLNKSLRWAVANALPVLTPQLFIGDKRLCDEDTDLGLEYTVSMMLRGSR